MPFVITTVQNVKLDVFFTVPAGQVAPSSDNKK